MEPEVAEEQREEMLNHMMGRMVVVENVPKEKATKYDKLLDAMTRIAGQAGEMGEMKLKLPKDESGGTMGFAFVEYKTPEVAAKAVKALQGYRMDQRHELAVVPLRDVDAIFKMDTVFDENQVIPNQESESKEKIDLPFWLGDERSREQFAVHRTAKNDLIEINWFDSVVGPEQNHAKEFWTDSKTMWSTKGNYFATFHHQGIALWGGPNWEKIMRFRHPNVQYAQFSKEEKYLVTWNGSETMPGEERIDHKCAIVWEVATGKPMRSFPVVAPKSRSAEKMENGEVPSLWPVFKWSHDDRFFARAGEDMISVYATPSMGLLDKKSLKIPDVQEFEWSPSDPILAYWTPEKGDSPARVCLLELPSRTELRQKGLYSVKSVSLKWKENGDYLGCRVIRYAKNRKHQYTNFELFHMRDKDYPIDILDFKEKEVVEAFEWEPKGNRFAVIHGEPPNKSEISFYSMESTSNGKLKHLFTLEKKPFNTILWSPAGALVVLGRLGNPNESMNGTFEWYNVNEQEMIGMAEHYCATGMEWDSSGRFVCSYTTCDKFAMDNGYIVYNISGKQLHSQITDKLFEFMWRPRPPLLLSPEQEKNVRKNIKKYRDHFEREDEELKESKRSGKAAERRELNLKWKEYLKSREHIIEYIKQKQEQMRPTRDEEYLVVQDEREEVVDIKEEVDYTKKMLTSDDERD